MSVELSVSCSQGRVAEWHDTIMKDGRRKGGLPFNADRALQDLNEHWYGDVLTTDAEKFNETFEADVQEFNSRQQRPCTKMGMESTNEKRQKSYYDGIVDGTFCYGKGKQQENPLYEAVLQIGNKDDNGITDADFDAEEYYRLKSEEGLDAASEYAKAHLNTSETVERTTRILKRVSDRLKNLDPEHFIVHRIDMHGDEPCGTRNIHICWSFRGTDYKKGMKNRCAADRALDQMGIKKSIYKDKQLSAFYEKVKDITEEEMKADALEYNYEPIKRKAPTGEKREHMLVEVYRDVEAQKQQNQKDKFENGMTKQALDLQAQENKRVKKINEENSQANEKELENLQVAKKATLDLMDLQETKAAIQDLKDIELDRKQKNINRQQSDIENIKTDAVKSLQILLDTNETDLYELQTLFKQKVKDVEDDKEKNKTDKENLESEKQKFEIEKKKSQDEMDLQLENISLRETALDDVKLDLDERKKKQEEDEAAFQVKEDALEAQKLANETKEAEVEEQKLENEKKEAEINQRNTELDKKANAIDTLIADAESYKSPVAIAKQVLNILKESMNPNGKHSTNIFINAIDKRSDDLNQKYQMQIDEIRMKREQIKQGVYFDTEEQQDELDRSK